MCAIQAGRRHSFTDAEDYGGYVQALALRLAAEEDRYFFDSLRSLIAARASTEPDTVWASFHRLDDAALLDVLCSDTNGGRFLQRQMAQCSMPAALRRAATEFRLAAHMASTEGATLA